MCGMVSSAQCWLRWLPDAPSEAFKLCDEQCSTRGLKLDDKGDLSLPQMLCELKQARASWATSQLESLCDAGCTRLTPSL